MDVLRHSSMSAPGNAHNHPDTLQKLERLNQLEGVTAEQRIRIEKYRTMYETLKAEHEQIEDSKLRLQSEMRQLKDDLKEHKMQAEEMISQVRMERDRKMEECEELKLQVMNPQKMEVLKVRLLEETEAPFKQKIEGLEAELERYRAEFNRLRYDYSFLKSEFEHELAQKKTVFEEIERKHMLEVDSYRKQIDALTEQVNNHDPGNLQKLRQLQKENVQLNLKVKSLNSELDELREYKESANLHADQLSRLQARQLSELGAQCRALETERESSKMQLERLQKELEKSIREQDVMSNDVHRLERENVSLKSQLDEATHAHRIETNNLKVNLTKERGDLERERDNRRVELNVSKNKTSILESNIADLKKALDLKEQEVARRVQAAKEDEWDRINKLESSKIQLESKISQLEQQRLDNQTSMRNQTEEMEERLRVDKESKERLERDLSNLKSSLLQEKQKIKDLEQNLQASIELRAKYQKLLATHESAAASEQETRAELEKANHNTDFLRRELEICQSDMLKQREGFNEDMKERSAKEEERTKSLQKRVSESEKELKELKKRHEKFAHKARKLNKKHKLEISTLTEQLQLLRTKEEHLELEKKSLMKNMSLEQDRLKRKFEKFRHRQSQFSQVLNHSNVLGFPDLSPVLGRTSSRLVAESLPRADMEPLGDSLATPRQNDH